MPPFGHDNEHVNTRAASSAHEPAAPTTRVASPLLDTPKTIKDVGFEPTDGTQASTKPSMAVLPRTTICSHEARPGRGEGGAELIRTGAPAPVTSSQSARPSNSLRYVTPAALPLPPARSTREGAATRPLARTVGSTAPCHQRRPPEEPDPYHRRDTRGPCRQGNIS
ncbi:hypothetical protein ZWY2020_056092 [Hordeum vulgare]|nr:hypothetical protein ZWY2020_056092 [Hordeum vulgare]